MYVCLFVTEGRKHDSGILADSGLIQHLQRHTLSPYGHPMCIYGAFSTSMSMVRASFEWLFGDIVNYFKFTDFKVLLRTNYRYSFFYIFVYNMNMSKICVALYSIF